MLRNAEFARTAVLDWWSEHSLPASRQRYFSMVPHWLETHWKSLILPKFLSIEFGIFDFFPVGFKNWARGNRKTLQRPKMMSKINFRNLKLKSHEEYLICKTYFVLTKTWFSSLNAKLKKANAPTKWRVYQNLRPFLFQLLFFKYHLRLHQFSKPS